MPLVSFWSELVLVAVFLKHKFIGQMRVLWGMVGQHRWNPSIQNIVMVCITVHKRWVLFAISIHPPHTEREAVRPLAHKVKLLLSIKLHLTSHTSVMPIQVKIPMGKDVWEEARFRVNARIVGMLYDTVAARDFAPVLHHDVLVIPYLAGCAGPRRLFPRIQQMVATGTSLPVAP